MCMDDKKAAQTLQDVRQWANTKIASGAEPPWSWYQYMKLIETIDAINAGMSSTSTTENSPQSVVRSGGALQLVDSKFQQDNDQRHHDTVLVQMPM